MRRHLPSPRGMRSRDVPRSPQWQQRADCWISTIPCTWPSAATPCGGPPPALCGGETSGNHRRARHEPDPKHIDKDHRLLHRLSAPASCASDCSTIPRPRAGSARCPATTIQPTAALARRACRSAAGRYAWPAAPGRRTAKTALSASTSPQPEAAASSIHHSTRPTHAALRRSRRSRPSSCDS
jgi:hypothetical protein